MVNRYGVDISYFRKELIKLNLSLEDRPAKELHRYLLTLAAVALPTPPTAEQGECANLQPLTSQGQNGTAGKPQVGECTTSAIG